MRYFEMNEEQYQGLVKVAELRKMSVDEWIREAIRNQIESDGNFHHWVKFMKMHEASDDTG